MIVNTGCETDGSFAFAALIVQGTSGLVSPKLCGENSGSHLYIDAGAGREEEAGLSAVISQSATWRIKVTT